MRIDTIQEFAGAWKNDEAFHKYVHNHFCERVNSTDDLKKLRDFIEEGSYGFGERSFYWMWKLIYDDIKKNKYLRSLQALEIGIHKGQILALWHILGFEKIYGISPMNGADGYDEKNDYWKDLKAVFEFAHQYSDRQSRLRIYETQSQGLNEYITTFSYRRDPAVVYIDGAHGYEEAWFDIRLYSECVAIGGYLVIDDCATAFNMPGMFSGIPTVSRAVDTLLPPHGKWPGAGEWKHLGNVVHNRIWQRVK